MEPAGLLQKIPARQEPTPAVWVPEEKGLAVPLGEVHQAECLSDMARDVRNSAVRRKTPAEVGTTDRRGVFK